MYYLLVFVLFLMAELLYFRVADRLNIVDKPNRRSSHSRMTLRGGGIIFPVSVFAFYLLHPFSYPWFLLGLAAIATISFMDDVREQSKKGRLLVHVLATLALLYQTGIFQQPVWAWLAGFAVVIGLLNACNFMDGINGMLGAVAFTTLLSLYYINQQYPVFEADLILYLLLGNLVFAFFNFRKKARCFAGDVGSISMAFCLLFLTTGLVVATGSLLLLLLFAVYGIDATLTVLHRLLKRENILQAHRQHLYQYLANECRWPHLRVSFLYLLIQAGISWGVVLLYRQPAPVQAGYAAMVLLLLAATYLVVKRRILKRLPHPATA